MSASPVTPPPTERARVSSTTPPGSVRFWDSKRNNVGGNDNVVRRTFNVAVNSPLVVVAPT